MLRSRVWDVVISEERKCKEEWNCGQQRKWQLHSTVKAFRYISTMWDSTNWMPLPYPSLFKHELEHIVVIRFLYCISNAYIHTPFCFPWQIININLHFSKFGFSNSLHSCFFPFVILSDSKGLKDCLLFAAKAMQHGCSVTVDLMLTVCRYKELVHSMPKLNN